MKLFVCFCFCFNLGLLPGQGLNQSCICQPMSQSLEHQIQAASVTYTTAHDNGRFLTHWMRPGIKPASSWFILMNHNRSPKFVCLLLMALHSAYGSSQARGWIRAATAGLHHSHIDARLEPHLQSMPEAHGNARSLTHWARPGIEPASSWILVQFLTYWATKGTPMKCFFFLLITCMS